MTLTFDFEHIGFHVVKLRSLPSLANSKNMWQSYIATLTVDSLTLKVCGIYIGSYSVGIDM